jgi:hypothetical protein
MRAPSAWRIRQGQFAGCYVRKHISDCLGYLVLKELEQSREQRVSLTGITSALKKKKVTQYRPIMFGLIFLHTIGAIDFQAPYIYRMKLQNDAQNSSPRK